MNASTKTFAELLKTHKDKEGMVFLGAGGDIQEWIEGISTTLHERGISSAGRSDNIWENAFQLTTTGGRVDLFLEFKGENNPLNIGKLAMWRLNFGDCSWWSDYTVNYAAQHGVVPPDHELDIVDEDFED